MSRTPNLLLSLEPEDVSQPHVIFNELVQWLDDNMSIDGWNIEPSTSYTIQASDNGKNIGFTNSGSIAVTLPDTLPVGFRCRLWWLGVGTPTATPDTDTVNGAGAGVAPSARWKSLYLAQFDDTEWVADI